MKTPVRNCPHCGAVLPLPDDLAVLKLACPFCQRDYLVTDVVAPELVAGYQRYYLRSTGAAVPAGDPNAAFIAAYSLPEAVATGIAKQIDLILAGI